MSDPTLILFAKKPLIGQVKTRLNPPLSKQQAKDVALFLIEQSIHNASQYWPGKIELSMWPDTNDETIEKLSKQYDFSLSIQSNGDLGKKMYTAIAEKIRRGNGTAIMGCDVPQCPASVFLKAYTHLTENKNIIGPSMDGGYYLIGLNQCQPDMFKKIQWGTKLTYQQTLLSCKAAGIRFDSTLVELKDLDVYDDLVSLLSYFPLLNKYRPSEITVSDN